MPLSFYKKIRIMKKSWIQKMVIAGTGVLASLAMFSCENMKPGGDGAGSAEPETKAKAGDADQKDAGKKVKFLTEVKPILEYYCLRCHNTGLLLGDLNLETRKLAFAPGEAGAFIIPKQPEASKLYHVLQLKEGSKEAMPPEKHRMTKGERELIYRWIKQGADWPKDSRGTLRPVVDGPAVVMVSGSW